ncbi:MAG: dinitrogenase reductase, partial [Tannerella sp.]|nr:dinitrogenase reductase [Tannerella sp.]
MGYLIIIFAIILSKAAWTFWMCPGNSSFETEKSDILKRRRYLINQTMLTPEQLLNKMPSAIGAQFQGEWTIYTYSMLSTALTNIAHIFSETKKESVQTIDSLI